MRTLVHVSDLHFGRLDNSVVEPLREAICRTEPDLLVVSGDLTQRAKSWQFKAAREFLESLPFHRVVVPGNHDIPLYNPFARFLLPLRKYRRFITADLQPSFVDQEIAVVGMSTPRSLVVKNGRINEAQLKLLKAQLAKVPDEVIRVVVTHHPFDLTGALKNEQLVGRAAKGMAGFAGAGIDLLLAGHVHVSGASTTAARYQLGGYSAVIVQAGTATSSRRRTEANAFNVIRTQYDTIEVESHLWNADAARFGLGDTVVFARSQNGWKLRAP